MRKLLLLTFVFSLNFTLFSQYIQTDVLVIGGGASGTTAGIQAARLGVKTLIVEETTWLGGMLTSAGVSAVDGNHNLPSGLWSEFRTELRKYYGGAAKVETGWVSNTLFEPYVGKEILKDMAAKELNLNILYETKFINVKKIKPDHSVVPNIEGGWLVVVKDKNGKKIEVQTRILVDATELGDVAKMAGIKYRIGTDAPSETGEKGFAIDKTNIVQDLTFAAILKDFGGNAPAIAKPIGYDPSVFDCACAQRCTNPKGIIECDKMLTYGKLPNDKYMINWPRKGNDFYANIIDADEKTRQKAIDAAKNHTLCFLYFIQNELGYKNLGLADDEFPTKDKLPFMPYYRESRRTEGVVTMTVNHILKPFEQPEPLYRTGIAVGDYPIDHHHDKYKGEVPKIIFPPVPSFNVPLGSLIPKGVEDFIVAEKSISVTNVVNGSTRLQPCVLLIGQAAGALAAVSAKENKTPADISVRKVQSILLEKGAYIMPYFDVKPDSPHFKLIQRIGATGILRGRAEPFKWANQTWFDKDSTVKVGILSQIIPELRYKSVIPDSIDVSASNDEKAATTADVLEILWRFGSDVMKAKSEDWNDRITFKKYVQRRWGIYKLKDFNLERPLKRIEIAILFDSIFDPFNKMDVDLKGNFKVKN